MILKDDFKGKYAIVPTDWLNKVAAFINNLCPGTGIRIDNPIKPSAAAPVRISVCDELANLLSGGGAADSGVVVDVKWDAANHKLVQTKRTAAGVESDTDIVVFEEWDDA